MAYPELTTADHYMRADAVHADLVQRTQQDASIYAHNTFGYGGDSTCLTGQDTAGVDLPQFDNAGLRAKIDDRSISKVIVPIRVPGKTFAGDHWVFYVLLRNTFGIMQAVYINPPADGYCGRHGIELALQLVQQGLPAMLSSAKAPHIVTSPYPNHTRFGDDITTLTDMGVEFMSSAQLKQARAIPARRGFAEKRLRGADDTSNSAAQRAREDAGFAPVSKKSPFAIWLGAALAKANLKDFILDQLFVKAMAQAPKDAITQQDGGWAQLDHAAKASHIVEFVQRHPGFAEQAQNYVDQELPAMVKAQKRGFAKLAASRARVQAARSDVSVTCAAEANAGADDLFATTPSLPVC